MVTFLLCPHGIHVLISDVSSYENMNPTTRFIFMTSPQPHYLLKTPSPISSHRGDKASAQEFERDRVPST
jgi:hypothetical protein